MTSIFGHLREFLSADKVRCTDICIIVMALSVVFSFWKLLEIFTTVSQ